MRFAQLGASAEAMLAAMATALEDFGVEVPQTRYVAAGVTPWDEPSLTLYLGSIMPGDPGRPMTSAVIKSAQFHFYATLYVQLLREVSSHGYGAGRYGLPAEYQMDVEGQTELTDAVGLAKAGATLLDNPDVCEPGVPISLGAVVPIGPEGGLAATRLTIEIPLSG